MPKPNAPSIPSGAPKLKLKIAKPEIDPNQKSRN